MMRARGAPIVPIASPFEPGVRLAASAPGGGKMSVCRVFGTMRGGMRRGGAVLVAFGVGGATWRRGEPDAARYRRDQEFPHNYYSR